MNSEIESLHSEKDPLTYQPKHRYLTRYQQIKTSSADDSELVKKLQAEIEELKENLKDKLFRSRLRKQLDKAKEEVASLRKQLDKYETKSTHQTEVNKPTATIQPTKHETKPPLAKPGKEKHVVSSPGTV